MRTGALPRQRLLIGLGLWVGALGLIASAQAQSGWQAYPALREVRAMDASPEAVWTATTGGVFAYAPSSGEITRYTPVEGLSGVEASALVYDPARDAIWLGYEDGVLDRLEVATGDVSSFFDIARADQFTDRGINRIRINGDSLFVATAFGLVVFDAAREEVRDTYSRLGPLDPGTPVNDAIVAPLPGGAVQGLWLATDAGVVYADLASPNLQQPSAWTRDDAAPAPATCLAVYQERLHACASQDALVRQAEGTWTPGFFTGAAILDIVAEESRLLGISQFRVFRFEVNVGRSDYAVGALTSLRALAVGPDGQIWVGDGKDGLIRLPEPGTETGSVNVEPTQVVIPEGPLLNTVAGLAVGPDGTLWVSHTRPSGRTGFSRLDANGWTTFASDDPGLDIATLTYESASVGPDGTFYAGSEGDGLTEVTPEGIVRTYRDDNSTLASASTSNPTFIVAADAMPDASGELWVTNRGAPLPLHVRTVDGQWQGLPHPPGVPSSVLLDRLVIDSFGNKWVTVRSSASAAGLGLAAISTGGDPLSPADDQGFYINEVGVSGVGLPSADVKALAFDLDDRLWIGTARGLAIIFSPGSAFGGDPSLVQPQWARTADGASFLLRDLDIADIAVDPAGQKWLASTTGAWLLNADGDTVVRQFSQENAPLFSDNIVAVAVDETTGRVYFATELGLQSVEGEASAPSPTVVDLTVAPSPYRPDQHSQGVLISGLVAETTVRVLTLDGQVVATLDGRGGSVRWDGRDDRTGGLAHSGVYLVAAIAANGEETAYGKIAVLR
ncbi:MAG: regulator [Rhodothermaceae bacterium]|nr:regulator [Rhodothermaceae bacterium]